MTEPEPSQDLGLAQVQSAGLERLDDLFDRLAAEVRNRRQLRLRLLQELADRLDAGALQAVVGADAQLELLDEDVVHRAATAASGRCAGAHEATGRARAVAACGLELLEALGIGEDRERLDEDLRRLAQRGLGI